MPGDMSEEGLKRECCLDNCYTRMKTKNLMCPKGTEMKSSCLSANLVTLSSRLVVMSLGLVNFSGLTFMFMHQICQITMHPYFTDIATSGKDDMHNPSEEASVDELKEECCEKIDCENNYCYAAMSEKGIWGQCPENALPLSTCDGHWPWSHDISDKMAAIKAKSADEIKKGCCRMRCHGTMKSRNLKCPAGYKGRSMWDGHDPFGNDWESKTDKEITEGCCEKLNKCSLKLRARSLSCDHYGRYPHGECSLLSSQQHRCNTLCIYGRAVSV